MTLALALCALLTPVAVAAQAAPEDAPKGTDQPVGSAPPPPIAHDHSATTMWDPAAMATAHAAMMDAHSVPVYTAVKVDLAEVQFGKSGDGYRWEGEAWSGDLNRFLLRTRGEGGLGRGARLESAELEAAYSRAISPWWNLQAGLRQDIRPVPARSYAMVALEGMAPYKFDLRAAAYLSDRGQLTARLEGTVDERITRRLILQPRAEIELAAQDSPTEHQGAGLTNAEFGLRLRYEVTRKFAPYIGVSWNWAAGDSAAYRRAQGEPVATRALVLGVKSWF